MLVQESGVGSPVTREDRRLVCDSIRDSLCMCVCVRLFESPHHLILRTKSLQTRMASSFHDNFLLTDTHMVRGAKRVCG